MISDPGALLTPREVAAILRISAEALYTRLSRKSDLPPSIKLGKLRRWRRETVTAWLAAKEGK